MRSATPGGTGLPASASAVAAIWPRIRDRSSAVAARVKVTISSSEGARSRSARNRVARVDRVKVLPVPALASMTTCPEGSSP